jgi:hypothetical protein
MLIMLLVDFCTTYIINLLLFIADLFHNDTLLSGWQVTVTSQTYLWKLNILYFNTCFQKLCHLGYIYSLIFMIETLDFNSCHIHENEAPVIAKVKYIPEGCI